MANQSDSLLAKVDTTLARALLERIEANHLDDADAPTVTDMAKRVFRVLADRMDEIAIVEPATTWEDAYKRLRHEVGESC